MRSHEVRGLRRYGRPLPMAAAVRQQHGGAPGESFASKSNAERAVTGFKSSAKTASYEFTGGGTAWYWHAQAT